MSAFWDHLWSDKRSLSASKQMLLKSEPDAFIIVFFRLMETEKQEVQQPDITFTPK